MELAIVSRARRVLGGAVLVLWEQEVESLGNGGRVGRMEDMDDTMLEAVSSTSRDCGRGWWQRVL